jgi:hypothetical protein
MEYKTTLNLAYGRNLEKYYEKVAKFINRFSHFKKYQINTSQNKKSFSGPFYRRACTKLRKVHGHRLHFLRVNSSLLIQNLRSKGVNILLSRNNIEK